MNKAIRASVWAAVVAGVVTGMLALPPVAKAAGSERGTATEAKAMLQKAIDHIKDVGREQAFKDFTAKKAPFLDRDLYVFCMGADHVITANGGLPFLVGTPADNMKAADGTSLGQAFADAGAGKNGATVHWQSIDPLTGKSAAKTGFVQKAGDDVCCVGVYDAK
jgi:cytochrome c